MSQKKSSAVESLEQIIKDLDEYGSLDTAEKAIKDKKKVIRARLDSYNLEDGIHEGEYFTIKVVSVENIVEFEEEKLSKHLGRKMREIMTISVEKFKAAVPETLWQSFIKNTRISKKMTVKVKGD